MNVNAQQASSAAQKGELVAATVVTWRGDEWRLLTWSAANRVIDDEFLHQMLFVVLYYR